MDDGLPLLRAQSPKDDVDCEHEDSKDLEKFQWTLLDQPQAHRTGWTTAFRIANTFVPWFITVLLSFYVLRTRTWSSNRFQQSMRFPSQLTYSPAQSEIQYVVHSFDHNLVNAPIEFQDPDTVDHAWASLYESGGATALSSTEAKTIPNETIVTMNGNSKEYIVQLEVFHQLHCLVRLPLDIVRHALEPFYGLKNDSLARLQANQGIRQGKQLPKQRRSFQDPRAPWEILGNVKHLNHCLNTLRQGIMCHSDISVNVWQWFEDTDDVPDPFGELRSGSYAFTNVAHTCRNFDRIRDWARARQMRVRPDFSAKPGKNDFTIPTWP